MRKTIRGQACRRLARAAALAGGLLLLAGCATGYSFVQPGVAGGGGYYTGEGPYAGQGYYDDYGTGPYYPGAGGYGYYEDASPYAGPYGYYGGDYGYGFGPQWTFGLGFSNAWNFPGYWGPWYSTGFALRGCYSWRCGNHHHRQHDGGHDDHHGHRTGSSWRHGGQHPSDAADLSQAQQREREVSAWRHAHYVHAPGLGNGDRSIAVPPPMPAGARGGAPGDTRFAAMPARYPADSLAIPPQEIGGAPRASVRAARAFAPTGVTPPADFQSASPITPMRAAPQPSYRAASPVTRTVAAPRATPSSSRNDGTPSIKIR